MPFGRGHGSRSRGSPGERARIRVALIELVGESGFDELALGPLLERASVSQAAFDRDFADLEDCFHQVFTELGHEFMFRMAEAFMSHETWRLQLRAVAHSMLEWLQEDPNRARFTFVESLKAGEATQATRDEFFGWLFALIDAGREELDDPEALTPATAAALGGAIFNQIRFEIEAGRIGQLDRLAPKLTYAAVLPYVGADAAAQELALSRTDVTF